jgi:protein gp37
MREVWHRRISGWVFPLRIAARSVAFVIWWTLPPIRFVSFEPLLEDLGSVNLTGVQWAIAGGESGPLARPVHPDWIRNIRDQCRAADVAFFFKQWGGVTAKAGGNRLDGRQWQQYPDRIAR